LSVPLETLFVLSLAASLLSSSGLSSLHPDIITLPLTPDIITLVPHVPSNFVVTDHLHMIRRFATTYSNISKIDRDQHLEKGERNITAVCRTIAKPTHRFQLPSHC